MSKKPSGSLSSIHIDEQRKKKMKPNLFPLWSSRRRKIQAFICVALGSMTGQGSMLGFSAAVEKHGGLNFSGPEPNYMILEPFLGTYLVSGVVWLCYLIWCLLFGLPLKTAEITLINYINNELMFVWQMFPAGNGILYISLALTFVVSCISHIFITQVLYLSTGPFNIQYSAADEARTRMDCYKASSNTSVSIYENCPSSIISYLSDLPSRLSLTEIKRDFYSEYSDLTKPSLFDSTNEETISWKSEVSHQEYLFPFLFLTLVSIIMVPINFRGIRSLEKISGVLVVVPYVLFVIFLIFIVKIDSSLSHIHEQWEIIWSKFLVIEVWILSYIHMVNGFMIGNLCNMFILVHGDSQDDILIDNVIMFSTQILSSFLFCLAYSSLKSLVLINYPVDRYEVEPQDYLPSLLLMFRGLDNVPEPQGFLQFLFLSYIIIAMIALQSFTVGSLVDTLMSMFAKLKGHPFYVTLGLCCTYFFIGSMIILFDIVRLPALDSGFVTISFLESITLFWIYGYQNIREDFHFLMGYKPSTYVQMVWMVSPIILLVTIIVEIYEHDLSNMYVHNVLILLFIQVLVFIIVCFVFMCRNKGMTVNVFKINPSWGPTDPILKKSREIFKSRVITKEHIYRQQLYKKNIAKPFNIKNQNIVQLQ